MTPFTIEASGLHKMYEEGAVRVHAVRGIDLRVAPGRLVLLMGPSGSGKSTLLSMLGCILRPSAGELRIMGEAVTWDERTLPLLRRRRLGFVFQHYNLLSSLTALENVAVMLRLQGVADAERRAGALLDAVGLSPRAKFLPRDLSGGEKQRVAVARALACEPPIVLADEPTGNLDSASGRTIVELLKKAAVERKCSVIVVTHDARVEEFADEVYWVEDGCLSERRPRSRTHARGSRPPGTAALGYEVH
jgi:putative ABC transport system ATP-binding protein